jgi:hypothetical protein
VHYNKKTSNNNYEYVDLNLPSGTLWATKNVGANNITDYGLYFAWGETTGYTTEQVGNDKDFTWQDYQLAAQQGNYNTLTKYNETDGKSTLEAIDDAATTNMGNNWHMPTKEQFEELANTSYCTNQWVENYQDSGVNGMLFTSVNNGNTIFFPTAGYCDSGMILSEGNNGEYWSNTNENVFVANQQMYTQPWSMTVFLTSVPPPHGDIYDDDPHEETSIGEIQVMDNAAYWGLSVRGVIG